MPKHTCKVLLYLTALCAEAAFVYHWADVSPCIYHALCA
jgi:hypothetical protein